MGMNNLQKLELRWFNKDKEIVIEPRILIENKELSSYDFDKKNSTNNLLIHGDNLLALKALESAFTNQVKCIYIDPPYNTGSAFEHYDDNLEHSIWLSLMKERLIILRKLLRDDGILFVQIDDNEQAYLKVLLDEIFGRKNFLNMISVKTKNIAGASGGGEDRRLKKNIEYILVYTKENEKFNWVSNAYNLTEIYELVNVYKVENISWKYTSILVNEGQKDYLSSTVDGDGNEIKIYQRKNYLFQSISQISKELKISEKEVYYKYMEKIHTTAMPQSSIRPRVMSKLEELKHNDYGLISIEYKPKSGKNRGMVYEQFYKGEKMRLITWLRDVVEFQNGTYYKKDLQGTFWDGINLNNLTKEGSVTFANGKKPEALISRILNMTTNPGDIILDSFLGSGTTAAVAHKMGRRWIGIEMGDHAYSVCKVRLDKVIAGTDEGGITSGFNWQGGGGYRFYELAPTLIKKDSFGQYVINPEYNREMLASAVARHEGYVFNPHEDIYWKQAKTNESSYLFVTTKHMSRELMESISQSMSEGEFLLVVCRSFDATAEKSFKNIRFKKIPQSLLRNCEFDVENYNLNIVNPPIYQEDVMEDDFFTEGGDEK
jgi:adenine-specific DNA-methyltransferase